MTGTVTLTREVVQFLYGNGELRAKLAALEGPRCRRDAEVKGDKT